MFPSFQTRQQGRITRERNYQQDGDRQRQLQEDSRSRTEDVRDLSRAVGHGGQAGVQDVRDLRAVGHGSQTGDHDSRVVGHGSQAGDHTRANGHGSQLGDLGDHHRTDGHGSQPDRPERRTCQDTTASVTGSQHEDESSSIGYGSQLGRSARGVSEGKWVNEVDSWIDDLELNRRNNPLNGTAEINSSVLMASLIQQQLPKVEIPEFDGSPLNWVEFIVKFRDVVHEQPYLNDKQRNQLLLQHLSGEAKRAVKEYANDPRGYPMSLQKLKYLFGQRSTVARAVLTKVTKGKPVGNRDTEGLSELYYSICDCLITLSQLNYVSDLYSSDTLYQTVQRLPSGLLTKWSERSLAIRKQQLEPNLLHLEVWLKDRLLALKEVCASGETVLNLEDSE